MNAIVSIWKRFHPFRWFLGLFGWSLSVRPDRDDTKYRRTRWTLKRLSVDEDCWYESYPRKEGPQQLTHIHSESHWFDKACHNLYCYWEVENGGGNQLVLMLGIPWICMHFIHMRWSRECWFKRLIRPQYEYENVGYGLKINEFAISWEWRCCDSWASDGSTGFKRYLSWDRFRESAKREEQLIFETKDYPFTMSSYRSRPVTEHLVDITYRMTLWRYRRPWNLNHMEYQVELSFKGGKLEGEGSDPLNQKRHPPAFSGKGENDWDCGDDGIWGVSFNINPTIGRELAWGVSQEHPCSQLLQQIWLIAVDEYVQDVQKQRERRG